MFHANDGFLQQNKQRWLIRWNLWLLFASRFSNGSCRELLLHREKELNNEFTWPQLGEQFN